MPRKKLKCSTFSQTNLSLNNNNNNNAEEVTEKSDNDTSKIAARKRWKILAKALFKHGQNEVADVSVRRFTSFHILVPLCISANWFEYSTVDRKFSIQIRHLQGTFTAEDLIGFNNTGNICIWPSEETLAIYIMENIHLFNGRTILELGGGMSCMAGLIVAKYSLAANVHVTDGNYKSIENVEAIIKKNSLEDKVSCSILQWEAAKENYLKPKDYKTYDIILVADCLFFDEVREDLIQTILHKLSDAGVAYIMAPQRGNTLDQFITTSQNFGFKCVKDEKYNISIWERHLDLLKTNLNYDPSLHYPILLKMTKVI